MIRSSWRRISGVVCLLAMAVALSGCVIVPVHPYHYHPYYYR